MAIRIAINGFGRIGRLVARVAKMRHQFDIVAVNDLGDGEQLASLFKYDSTHGIFPGEVTYSDGKLTVDDDTFEFIQERDPASLPWKDKQIDYVIEASGVFRKRADLEKHLSAGAKRIVLTVPAKDPIDATVVLGVNDDDLKPEHTIVSNASCTTNCVAPMAKVLHDAFGIKRGMLNTVHAFTNDQHLMDGPHKSDARRARMATASIIPTSTGAATAVGKVLPELSGKLSGMAMRVPVPDASIVDLVVELGKQASVEEVNQAFYDAEDGPMGAVLHVNREEPIVSVDIIGNPFSCIVDAPLTEIVDGNLVRVCAWYDNEWGYANRVVDMIERMAKQDGLELSMTPHGISNYRTLKKGTRSLDRGEQA